MATYLTTGTGRTKAIVRRRGHPTTCKTCPSRKEAELWAAEIERRMDTGEHIDFGGANRLPLRKVIEDYSRRYTGAKKGWRQELDRVKYWARQPLADRPIIKVRSRDIAEWIRSAEQRGLAPSTIRNLLQVVSQAFRFAVVDLGYEHLVNPTKNVRLPPMRPGRDRRLEPGEYERLQRACRSLGYEPLWAVIVWAVETAMRRGEILALAWTDVRPRSVIIRRSKTNRQRAVALSPVAQDVLKAQKGRSPVFVFPEFAGSSGDRVLEKKWYRALEHADIQGLRFHDLRHEGVSRLFEQGLSVPEVMSISGHTTMTMLARYAHAQTDRLADKLADASRLRARASARSTAPTAGR